MGRKTKRKTNKKIQKIIISVICVIVAVILIYCGANKEVLNAFGKATGIDVSYLSNFVSKENIAQDENSKESGKTSNELIIDGSELQVYYIDVGQADSILIINNNQSMLIDAGNNDDGKDVVKFIKDKGITNLDYVVGTHPHEDHIGGLDNVIDDIGVQNVLMPKMQTNTKTFESVLNSISNKGLTINSPNKGDTFTVGNANCEVMTDSISNKDNLNLSSIVIRLTFGNNSFLFMGDAEKSNEETRQWPKTDVLKVGHHGSETSSGEDFLKQVSPKYSIIMVGQGNTYGLPKASTIKRLEKINTQIFRTDESGTITAISDGENISIEVNAQS